jgi:hypothetical protein
LPAEVRSDEISKISKISEITVTAISAADASEIAFGRKNNKKISSEKENSK